MKNPCARMSPSTSSKDTFRPEGNIKLLNCTRGKFPAGFILFLGGTLSIYLFFLFYSIHAHVIVAHLLPMVRRTPMDCIFIYLFNFCIIWNIKMNEIYIYDSLRFYVYVWFFFYWMNLLIFYVYHMCVQNVYNKYFFIYKREMAKCVNLAY